MLPGKKPGYTDFSEDDIEFVKGNNKLNIQLYKYATELFNEIINDLPNGFQNELNQLNRNNKFRAAFYAMPRFKRRISRYIVTPLAPKLHINFAHN